MGNIAEPKKLKCKIINIEPDPRHPNRTIVSLKIDDGEPEPYIRSYSLLPPAGPMSLEKFSIDLSKMDLSRPDKPFHYLQEAMEHETSFEVTPDPSESD